MRESMTSFNEARFKAECAVIDSVVRADGRSFEVLPGGVIVQRAKAREGASWQDGVLALGTGCAGIGRRSPWMESR